MFASIALQTVACCSPAVAAAWLADLVLDVVVPPSYGQPSRVEPKGAEWGKHQSTLRWRLGGVYPGFRGQAVAAFRVAGGYEAAVAGVGKAYALVRMRGVPGEL